jgi:hypothetical protein
MPEGVLQWGRKVTGVHAFENARHEVRFANGGTALTRALIGQMGPVTRQTAAV